MNEAIGRYERSFPGLTTTVVTRKLLFVESRRVVSHSIEAPEQPTFIPRGVRPTGPDHPTGVHWRSLSTVWGSRPARTPLGMSRYTLVGQRPIQNRAKSSYTGLYRGLNPEAERVCVCVSTPVSKELALHNSPPVEQLVPSRGAVDHYHSLPNEDSDSSVVI